MNILLTGSTGFIGGRFLRLAIERGHTIIGLILPDLSIPEDLRNNDKVIWCPGSLSNVPWNHIKPLMPDVCVHTAWITTPGIYLESTENYKFLEDSLNFINSAIHIGISYVLATGTCIEYKPSKSPLKEDTSPVEPTTVYAKCKNQLRLQLEQHSKKMNYRFCWARIFYPYGVGEHPDRLCSSLIRKLSNNEKVFLKTPYSVKDYIYIDDLADALLTVLENRFSGIINIGSGIGISVLEIAELISQLLDKKGLIEKSDTPDIDPYGYMVADVSRLKSLGWQQKISMKDGLQKMLSAMVKNY